MKWFLSYQEFDKTFQSNLCIGKNLHRLRNPSYKPHYFDMGFLHKMNSMMKNSIFHEIPFSWSFFSVAVIFIKDLKTYVDLEKSFPKNLNLTYFILSKLG